jgi:hypothetical protein
MINLLATLVVTVLPVSPPQPGAYSACPDPTPPAAEVGECDQVAPLDLWYRMSRFADPEPSGLAAGAARRAPSNQQHRAASCDAPNTPAPLTPPSVPPVALVALPTLLPLHVPSHFDADARDLPARAIAPPERPPRA